MNPTAVIRRVKKAKNEHLAIGIGYLEFGIDRFVLQHLSLYHFGVHATVDAVRGVWAWFIFYFFIFHIFQ